MKYRSFLYRYLFFLIFFHLTGLLCVAQNNNTEVVLDSIPSWMLKAKVPVMGVGIIENGKIKIVKVLGTFDNGKPAPLNTLFNVASLTKPVTALTILKLVNAGKLILDEPLYKYWLDPELKGNLWYKKLNTRLILSHQTGFPNWRSDTLKFIFEPGTKFGYSGEGFEYLRKAAEAKFHTDLQQLAYVNVFKPLRMQNTRYGWSTTLDSTRFANPHDGKGKLIASTKLSKTNAADWLVTTIQEYTTFGVYFMNGGELSKSLFKEIVTPQVNITPNAKETMGLGWEVIRNLESGGYLLMHTGQDSGVNTLIVLLPESGKGIVLLSNSDNGFDVMKQILKNSLNIKEITP